MASNGLKGPQIVLNGFKKTQIVPNSSLLYCPVEQAIQKSSTSILSFLVIDINLYIDQFVYKGQSVSHILQTTSRPLSATYNFEVILLQNINIITHYLYLPEYLY